MNELAAAERSGQLTDKEREKLLYPGRVMLTSESFVSFLRSIGVGCACCVCRCDVGVVIGYDVSLCADVASRYAVVPHSSIRDRGHTPSTLPPSKTPLQHRMNFSYLPPIRTQRRHPRFTTSYWVASARTIASCHLTITFTIICDAHTSCGFFSMYFCRRSILRLSSRSLARRTSHTPH